MQGIFLSHALNRLVVILSEDIGFAETGLAKLVYNTYTGIWKRRKLHGDLCPKNKQALMSLVKEFSTCRHSRYTDEVIHWYDLGKIHTPDTSLQVFRSSLKAHDYETASAIVINVHNSGERLSNGTHARDPRKRLVIFLYWDVLREYSKINEDIDYLYKLYELRKDLLQLIHAVGIVVYGIKGTTRVPKKVKYSWEYYTNLRLPLLNQAVDAHTQAGRNLLGRGMVYFFTEGAKLAKQTIFDKEQEYRDFFIDHYREIEGYNRYKPLQPRKYQQGIVAACYEHFEDQDRGRLEIACGAGKTFTTFLIKQELQATHVLVLVPRLLILNGFYECWRDQIIAAASEKYRIGVVASDIANTVKNDYCCHIELETVGDIEQYLCVSGPRIIFSTYASVDKVLEAVTNVNFAFDLTICDEAHHLYYHTVLELSDVSKKLLFQTATETPDISNCPELFGEKIATYNFREAINDGYLVDYTGEVISSQDMVQEIRIATEKCCKLIVFSRNNTLSHGLYTEYLERCEQDDAQAVNAQAVNAQAVNAQAVYVDCNVKMADRQNLIDSFQHSDRAVIFNCGLLGEGVDLPECDGIFFTYPKTSFVDTVQTFGRCLRVDPKNPSKKAYIKMVYSTEQQKSKYMSMIDKITLVDPEIWKRLMSKLS